MFRIFKTKAKIPMKEAIKLVDQAVEMGYQYSRDKKYLPTAIDLSLFDKFAKTLWDAHCMAEYISRNMHQRSKGEPEGAAKWMDEEVFDYHYPP